jgi:ketopantoate reductase
VVPSPEDAAGVSRASFDYVILCVKALPDIYDLASIIESVVAPQHTCILVNTTQTLGVESYLEQRFPTNVVLSLISCVEITQLSASEFEHKGASDLWVGAANRNPAIPASIQNDMAEALSMTLRSGDVNCVVSPNIKQLQYERMIGYVLHAISMSGKQVADMRFPLDLLHSTRPASYSRHLRMPSFSRRLARVL